MKDTFIYCEADDGDGLGMSMAKEVGEYLHQAYPSHFWHVRVSGGCVIVKEGHISSTIGMVRHLKDIAHDANVRRKDIIRAAGELLERAAMRRGRYDGLMPTRLEGGEKLKWKPRILVPPTFH